MNQLKSNQKDHALIYCRTSFDLEDVYDAFMDQEIRCRAHAAKHGYHVARVFYDKCDNSLLHPPSLASAFECARDPAGARIVVITDQAKRLAPDKAQLNELIQRLEAEDARLEFADPEIEHDAAAFGLKERDVCDVSRFSIRSFREVCLPGVGGEV